MKERNKKQGISETICPALTDTALRKSTFAFSSVSAALFFLLSVGLIFAGELVAEEDGPLYHEGVPSYENPSSVVLPDFAWLAKKIRPAVVNISSEAGEEGEEEEEEAETEHQLPPFLRRDPSKPIRSLGSGFIVEPSGYIVTNNHVVENSGSIIVRIPDDKTPYEATLIGRDPKTDLALIKIEAGHPLDILYLGDSENLEVGEWVLAVGNQFQLGQSFTAGIVSAKSRRVPTRSSGPYDQFIQTDASINPGSSGGPLVNTKGQVVGINTAIFSPGRAGFGGSTGFNIGIGFSVPINLAKDILNQLRKSGKVTRGLLGVIIQSITPELKSALGVSSSNGALVADVLDDTPAQEAGFQREDIILKYQGKDIEEHDDLPLLVASTPVGTTVEVEVLRSGKLITLNPKVGELKDRVLTSTQVAPQPDELGLVVETVNEKIAKTLGQPTPHGVIIAQVESGSAGERSGLVRGDVIEEFNRQVLRDADAYAKAVGQMKKGQPVLLLVRRREGTRFLTIEKASG